MEIVPQTKSVMIGKRQLELELSKGFFRIRHNNNIEYENKSAIAVLVNKNGSFLLLKHGATDDQINAIQVSQKNEAAKWEEKELWAVYVFTSAKWIAMSEEKYSAGITCLTVLENDHINDQPVAYLEVKDKTRNIKWSHSSSMLAVSSEKYLWMWKAGQTQFQAYVEWPVEAGDDFVHETGLIWSPNDRWILRYGERGKYTVPKKKIEEILASGDHYMYLSSRSSLPYIHIVDMEDRGIVTVDCNCIAITVAIWDGDFVHVNEELGDADYRSVTIDPKTGALIDPTTEPSHCDLR